MNRIERCFQGVAIGSKCTGTIHFFSLDAKGLLDQNIIRLEKSSLIASATEKSKAIYGYDYIFCGLK